MFRLSFSCHISTTTIDFLHLAGNPIAGSQNAQSDFIDTPSRDITLCFQKCFVLNIFKQFVTNCRASLQMIKAYSHLFTPQSRVNYFFADVYFALQIAKQTCHYGL